MVQNMKEARPRGQVSETKSQGPKEPGTGDRGLGSPRDKWQETKSLGTGSPDTEDKGPGVCVLFNLLDRLELGR